MFLSDVVTAILILRQAAVRFHCLRTRFMRNMSMIFFSHTKMRLLDLWCGGGLTHTLCICIRVIYEYATVECAAAGVDGLAMLSIKIKL